MRARSEWGIKSPIQDATTSPIATIGQKPAKARAMTSPVNSFEPDTLLLATGAGPFWLLINDAECDD